MEDAELDEWFSEQREKLEEKVQAGIAGKNPLKAKQDFDKQYRALILEYQTRQGELYDARLRSARMQAPITHAKEVISLFFKRISDSIKSVIPAVKKWLFERKIRKILKDKSNLYR